MSTADPDKVIPLLLATLGNPAIKFSDMSTLDGYHHTEKQFQEPFKKWQNQAAKILEGHPAIARRLGIVTSKTEKAEARRRKAKSTKKTLDNLEEVKEICKGYKERDDSAEAVGEIAQYEQIYMEEQIKATESLVIEAENAGKVKKDLEERIYNDAVKGFHQSLRDTRAQEKAKAEKKKAVRAARLAKAAKDKPNTSSKASEERGPKKRKASQAADIDEVMEKPAKKTRRTRRPTAKAADADVDADADADADSQNGEPRPSNIERAKKPAASKLAGPGEVGDGGKSRARRTRGPRKDTAGTAAKKVHFNNINMESVTRGSDEVEMQQEEGLEGEVEETATKGAKGKGRAKAVPKTKRAPKEKAAPKTKTATEEKAAPKRNSRAKAVMPTAQKGALTRKEKARAVAAIEQFILDPDDDDDVDVLDADDVEGQQDGFYMTGALPED